MKRPGKSLMEMLLLISILTVIMSLVATTLVAVFKTDRQIRQDLDQQTALARLGSKFRADAHAAAACQVGVECELTLADGRVIRYSAKDRKITREVRRGNSVEHRDAFLLPATATARFDLPAQSQGHLVRLSIQPAENSDRAYLTPVRPAIIDAAIGLGRRPEATP